ncbi:hypothetical protein OCOL_000841 [Ordospora colligata]
MEYGVFCRERVAIRSVSSGKYLSPLTLELENEGIGSVIEDYAFEWRLNNRTNGFNLGTDKGDIGIDLSSGNLVYDESVDKVPDHGFYFKNPPRCKNMIGYNSLCMQEINGEVKFSECPSPDSTPDNSPDSFLFVVKTFKNFPGRTDAEYVSDQVSTQDMEADSIARNANNTNVYRESIMDSDIQSGVDTDLYDRRQVDNMIDYKDDGAYMDSKPSVTATNRKIQDKCNSQYVFLMSIFQEIIRNIAIAIESQNNV